MMRNEENIFKRLQRSKNVKIRKKLLTSSSYSIYFVGMKRYANEKKNPRREKMRNNK